jgi:hypothetical protein
MSSTMLRLVSKTAVEQLGSILINKNMTYNAQKTIATLLFLIIESLSWYFYMTF